MAKQLPVVNVNYEVDTPRFSVENIDELQRGVAYLTERGYAVFSNILKADEITVGVDLLWEHLENLERPCYVRRNDPQTWDRNWPGLSHTGLLNDYGIGQSEFMWYIRGHRHVKTVFSQIWNSKELCTSFDGAGCYRNWHLNSKWKTTSGWYHCDQNPFQKPTRCSVQGFVALTDNDESTGGLAIVPHSHEQFVDLQFQIDETQVRGDFVFMPSDIVQRIHPRLVKCKAGDLVVWDSRCIHCNTPALLDQPKDTGKELLRIVAYVCMSPLSLFEPDGVRYESLEEFRELREDFVRDRVTCTHWPLELITATRSVRQNQVPLKLTGYQHSLIIGTDVQLEDHSGEMIF